MLGSASSSSANGPYPDYFKSPAYKAADYSKAYGEVLPGADFNKQVYEFNANKPIWDQNDYEERVKVEAEMLVALEALKESVVYLGHDIRDVVSRFQSMTYKFSVSQTEVFTIHESSIKTVTNNLART